MLFFGTQARLFKIARFQDPVVKHMLSKLQNIDKAALPKDELQEVMEGAPRSPGTCSPARGGWVSCWMGSRSVWGRREVAGAGPELSLGEGESGDWWEDASARPTSPSWWGWRWGWADGHGPALGDTCPPVQQASGLH